MQNKAYVCIIMGLLFLAACDSPSANDWKNIETVDALWKAYPDRLRSLFSALDLEQSALEPVRSKLTAGDTIAAGEALIEYYSNVDRKWIITALDPLTYEVAAPTAQHLLLDSITRENTTVKIPTTKDGGWKWNYTGLSMDDEFGYSLNGHSYLPALYTALGISLDHSGWITLTTE